jgi:glycosyltransferase involved in cell wall biosynthesis
VADSRKLKLSVVVPVYNDADRIGDALAALLAQTYPRDAYEIVVADNGSCDGSRGVAEGFQAKAPGLVRLVVEDDVQGSYAARNKGVCASQGEILAFTDADCRPVSEWIEEGVRAIVQSGAALAAGRIKMTFRGERPNIWEYYDAAGKLNQQSYVERAGFGATANLFVRRRMFDEYGLFRDDLQSGGDYEFGRRLTTAGEKLVYADRALVYHPARASFRSKLSKSSRVARGQRQLAELGLLEHATLSWHRLIPALRCPPLEGVRLGVGQRVAVTLIAVFFRYYNLLRRIG